MSDMGVGLSIPPRSSNGLEKGSYATIQDGIWKSDDRELKMALDGLRLYPGHHGDRDLELAELAAKLLGGKVTDRRGKPKNLHQMPV